MYQISVVVPCFNEEKRLVSCLNDFQNFSEEVNDIEFVFVNDGSTDKTEELLQKHLPKHSKQYRTVSYPKNKGKGGAFEKGAKKAKGKYIGLCDIDNAHCLDALFIFREHMRKEVPVIIGSRYARGSKIVNGTQQRNFVSFCFRILSYCMFQLPYTDTQCGFKFFRKEELKTLLKASRIHGWGKDFELLYLARKYKMKVEEVPLRWEHNKDYNFSIVRVIGAMFHDMLKIKWNNFRRKYEK